MCFSALFVFWGILFCAPCRCLECPFGCECFAVIHTVKCVSKDLLTAPQNIPGFAKTVIMTGNNIHQIGPSSFTELENITNIILSNNRITQMASHTFSSLINLRFLDLSGNQLALIHPEALSIPGSPLQELNLSQALYNFTALTDLTTALRWGGLAGLLRLDLSGNKLALLPPGMFSHLPNLQQLFLANNALVAVYSGTFSGMNHLEVLDLTHNAFRTLRTDALQELEKLGDIKILLGNNPYTCSCEIHDFVTWLNKSRAKVDANAVRCASPVTLTDTRLRGLSVQDIGCVVPVLTEVANLTLQTSYVFLGLVLGFVGMVFLFVLYLNRKGMKKWINEMRDACRDVLEGYHYRYEIDSDPRLGHISADSRRAQRQLGLSLSQQLPSDTSVIHTKTQVKPVTTSLPVNL
ncbi:trophoblast glycoprotein-like [Archocentrus centrarchus]|uniref:trophoblast glycoprotein-like n=1 Tax=Archocentrus centrarchus TaxID=63155 RepID=UPI0011EA35FB|nr:trophoblast glycoprotein-like [Archocentrus centrarchus]